MTRCLVARVAVVPLFGLVSALVVPACTLRLQQGSADETEDRQVEPPTSAGDESAGSESGQADPGGGPIIPPGDEGIPHEDDEEVAAFNEVIASADRYELALLDLKTQYTAYALAAVVQEQVGEDLAAVDPAVVQQVIDAYAPIVWDQAEQWVTTLDPSTVELAKITPREDCVDKWDFGCRRKSYCDFEDDKTYGSCIVTGCGEGRCPVCPRFLDLNALIMKGWCTYTCVRDKQIVGTKIQWHFRINKTWEECWLLETPIPMDP